MDFCADKASGVKFCSVFQQRPSRESQIFVNFAPQKSRIGRIGQRAGHAHRDVNITVEIRRRKLHARDAPFRRIGMCGYTSVPFGRTYLFNYLSHLICERLEHEKLFLST